MKMITDYKKLLLISCMFIVLCAGIIGYGYYANGEILDKSIDFDGGTIASVSVASMDVDIAELNRIADQELDDVLVRSAMSDNGTSIVFESERIIEETQIHGVLDDAGLQYDDDSINIQTVGPSLGQEFMRESIYAVVFAFLLMGVIIFLSFKSVVPSVAIISAAIVDIMFAVAMMSLFEIKLSLGTMAALLLLIGYSVDTDILLTTRLIKRKSEGSLDERISNAMKTGLTMTTSAIIAFSMLYLISSSSMLDQIALVVIFGLLADYVTTWFQNAGLLRWYLKDDVAADVDMEEVKKPRYVRKNASAKKKGKKGKVNRK